MESENNLNIVDDSVPAQEAESSSKKNKYRKEKPWDTPDIDKWKIEEFLPEHNSQPFTEESSFATLFPKYREKYLREIWPHVTRELEKRGIACVLDLIEGSMTVKTTRKTWDPYMIIRARDLIKLLARSVPLQQALDILQDNTTCDIIKIDSLVRNKERFLKRRQRLVGPNGNTLKAIEMLTGCFVLVQGNTVALMGTWQAVKQVRRLVLDCMKNIHPIYYIKEWMVKRELAKDPKLANENWSRFLPQFRKRIPQQKKKVQEKNEDSDNEGSAAPAKKQDQTRKKKVYTPFPPAQTPRKIDLQIESGEYFLSNEEKKIRELEKRKQNQQEAAEKKQREREQAFMAPEEPTYQRKSATKQDVSVEELKQKILSKKSLKTEKKEESASMDMSDFILPDHKEKKKSKREKSSSKESSKESKKSRKKVKTE